MADEWGPWIEHDGRGCPVPDGTVVEVMVEGNPGDFFGPVEFAATKEGLSWYWTWWMVIVDGEWVARIVRYRLRRPNALRRLIDIAADPERGMPARFPVEELV